MAELSPSSAMAFKDLPEKPSSISPSSSRASLGLLGVQSFKGSVEMLKNNTVGGYQKHPKTQKIKKDIGARDMI